VEIFGVKQIMLKSKTYKNIVLPLVILFVSLIVVFLLMMTQKSTKVAPIVEKLEYVHVAPVVIDNYQATITKTGKVTAAKKITLRSEVAGAVNSVESYFLPGYLLNKGDLLVNIDPRVYEIELRKKQAALKKAQSEYDIALGKYNIAQAEFKSAQNISGAKIKSNDLVLRKPHLKIAEAKLANAHADLDHAQLNYDKTFIKSPFDAMILSRIVNEADIMQVNGPIAKLVATEQFWVELLVPIEKLRWFVPKVFAPNKEKLKATVVMPRDKSILPGYILKIVRNLDDMTKMGKIIVAIDDPLQLKKLKEWKAANMHGPAPAFLLLGDHVEVNLSGHMMNKTVKVEHAALHDSNYVWVLVENKLAIREVNVIYTSKNYYYIDKGLNAGDLLITSNISVPKEGMILYRFKESPSKV
jgi:multidrug resistance efflux pump